MEILYILLGISVIIFVVLALLSSPGKTAQYQKKIEDEYRSLLDIPGGAGVVHYFEGIPCFDRYISRHELNLILKPDTANPYWGPEKAGNMFVWEESGRIFFALSTRHLSLYFHYPGKPKNRLIDIGGDYPVFDVAKEKVTGCERTGEFFETTAHRLGRKASLSGAVSGAIADGGIGSFWGVRTGITKNTTVIDNRKTILSIELDGDIKKVAFDGDAYEVFVSILPDG